MNVFIAFSRVLVMATLVVGFTNMAGNFDELNTRHAFGAAGSLVAPMVFKEKSGVILTKSCAGSIGYIMSDDKKIKIKHLGSNKKETRERSAGVHAVGYVFINGTLRYVADKYSINEESIDKKCDEYLHENVAWIVKPVAKVAVDLAYDYLTVEMLSGLVEGFVDGINGKKDESARNSKRALHLRRE